ncbi:DUF4267 domain-containing protein [Microlunatus elymi]|uniref:DUF4267 domain-containing protein n=1 Tax=Microlunatus elymi TaxID=2596828 RepID=A0A516PXI0_9ACTN|nr:DUF4267 domain-containing protein [Microlunatus elymi]QDP95884.1 DUF4267 domain-containing protein [Microlunatus elymi]
MTDIIGSVLVWIVSIMIIGIGIAYLFRNQSNAAGFGLPVLPEPAARGWWQVKGVRDITTGIAPITLFFVQPAALPWLILAEALIPIGDMLVILGNGGSRARAFGIHGLTALVMIIAAILLWL